MPPTKPGTYATFQTSEGTIVCELFEKDAPETVKNFIGRRRHQGVELALQEGREGFTTDPLSTASSPSS